MLERCDDNKSQGTKLAPSDLPLEVHNNNLKDHSPPRGQQQHENNGDPSGKAITVALWKLTYQPKATGITTRPETFPRRPTSTINLRPDPPCFTPRNPMNFSMSRHLRTLTRIATRRKGPEAWGWAQRKSATPNYRGLSGRRVQSYEIRPHMMLLVLSALQDIFPAVRSRMHYLRLRCHNHLSRHELPSFSNYSVTQPYVHMVWDAWRELYTRATILEDDVCGYGQSYPARIGGAYAILQ